jgi:hypothetical protein
MNGGFRPLSGRPEHRRACRFCTESGHLNVRLFNVINTPYAAVTILFVITQRAVGFSRPQLIFIKVR